MEGWALARALHVLGVVLWIGGVAMVTLVLLPAIRGATGVDRLALFERLEQRFARQSRWTTIIVGASGFYLVHSLGLWPRFADPAYWWMHAMVIVWAVFTLVLFVLEPLLHRRFAERARRDPDRALASMSTLHGILLAASLLTIAGAVAGSHGVQLFSLFRVLS